MFATWTILHRLYALLRNSYWCLSFFNRVCYSLIVCGMLFNFMNSLWDFSWLNKGWVPSLPFIHSLLVLYINTNHPPTKKTAKNTKRALRHSVSPRVKPNKFNRAGRHMSCPERIRRNRRSTANLKGVKVEITFTTVVLVVPIFTN